MEIGNGLVERDSTPVIAKPSNSCCLKGNLHDGQPRGRVLSIAGVDTYMVEPSVDKANGHVVLYFPDVWGFFANAFLIMDGFADAGFLTLGMDYFQGVSDKTSSETPAGLADIL